MTTKDKNIKNKRAAALKYDQGDDAAPKLTAKGRGFVAEKILEMAKEHGVPIKEDKDLVEALSTIELSADIPPELFKAVAEVLAFIYRVRQRSA